MKKAAPFPLKFPCTLYQISNYHLCLTQVIFNKKDIKEWRPISGGYAIYTLFESGSDWEEYFTEAAAKKKLKALLKGEIENLNEIVKRRRNEYLSL